MAPDLSAEQWRENNDNLAWVRGQNATLRNLGFQPPTSLARIGEWLRDNKGPITKALREREGYYDDEEEDSQEGDE